MAHVATRARPPLIWPLSFSRGLASCCEQTAKFAAEEGKPVAIAEFGMQGGFGSKGPQYVVSPRWFTDAFLRPVMDTPSCRRIAYALTWTNAGPDKYYIPLAHQGAHSSFAELYRGGTAVFAGQALEQLGITQALLAEPEQQSTGRRTRRSALATSMRSTVDEQRQADGVANATSHRPVSVGKRA